MRRTLLIGNLQKLAAQFGHAGTHQMSRWDDLFRRPTKLRRAAALQQAGENLVDLPPAALTERSDFNR